MKDLMQKRFIVVAGTPFEKSPSVGTILTLEESGVNNWLTVRHNDFVYSEMMLQDYPHLFRELQWWEYRDESEMPKYVKHRDKIYKVTGWWGENCPYIEGEKHPFAPEVFIPATEKDFNEYINSKKLN